MKNLHNWALISEDAALLAAAKNNELPNVIHRLRKYREEGETIEACLPVFAAIIALSAAFPEILRVSFKSQKIKTEWALFCKMQGWCDLSGRVQKPMKIVSMESGNLVDVETNMRLDPPARQAWLPWVRLADDVLQALMQAYAKTPRETEEKPRRWLQQSQEDIAETYWLEQKFSFGGGYVRSGRKGAFAAGDRTRHGPGHFRVRRSVFQQVSLAIPCRQSHQTRSKEQAVS